jgi:hypothetical protein
MRRVSYAADAPFSVTNLVTSESESEKWPVGWFAYAILPTREQRRSMAMMNGIDRWSYDERGARRSWVSSTRKAIRGRDLSAGLSDLVITSEGCAKEVVISHLSAS